MTNALGGEEEKLGKIYDIRARDRAWSGRRSNFWAPLNDVNAQKMGEIVRDSARSSGCP